MATIKKICAIKTEDGNPVRCEEAWKDSDGNLLTSKATKVSTTEEDTIFVNDGHGNLKDSGKSIRNIMAYVNGGIEFSGTASKGTLVGDFEGLTQAQLMRHWPFSALYIEDVDSYSSDGTALGVKDSFLVMPNMWRKAIHSEDGSSTFMIANYQVDETYTLAYPSSDFKELCLAVYFASLGTDIKLHSVAGASPKVGINQATLIADMPYYKRGEGVRRAEYLDYRVMALYQILSVIYLGTRNTQSVYRGICDYKWSKGSVEDITDEPSKLTGVTELGTSVGFMAHKVVSGEITGTSFTESLASGKRPFKLLGVENPYGFLWQNMYGLVYIDGEAYAYNGVGTPSASELVPGSDGNCYTDTGILCAQSNGRQKAFADASGYPVPISVGASASTSVGDRVYLDVPGGTYITAIGGRCDNGSFDGLFCLSWRDAFNTSFVGVGARLSFER